MLGDYIFSSVIFIVATRLQSARLFLTARGQRSLRGYAFITLDFYFTGTLLKDTMKLGGSWQGMSRFYLQDPVFKLPHSLDLQ